MIKKDKYYSAFEISWAGFIPHANNTRTVINWLERFRAKYPKKVIVRKFGTRNQKLRNGKVRKMETKRYSIKGENIISLIAHIEDGSI